jgi:hypothetical protein
MRSSSILFALGLSLFLPRAARAADVIFDHLAPGTIKMDGKIKDFPGTTAASETIKAGKASASFVAGYDDQGIWLGGEVVKDGGVGRTGSFGPNEDCISLVLGIPKNGVGKGSELAAVHEIGVYAGVPGSSAGIVKFRAGPLSGKTVDGAKVIEAPRKGGGYSVEAFVPWSAIPEAKKVRAGLRGALRMYEGDGTTLRAIKASGPGSVESPSQLGYLLIEPEQSLPQALAQKKQTWKDVTFEVSADMTGDAVNERAMFVGRMLYVLGPGFQGGKQWLVMDAGADVVAVDTRDVTGDGKDDLLLTTRIKAGTTREAIVVYSLASGTPKMVFGHETLVESGANALRDKIEWKGGKKPSVSITYLAPKGWTVDSYKEPIASDLDPILWPWGPVKERTFVWNGGIFAKDKEIAQKAQTPTAPAQPATPTEPKPVPIAPAGDLVAGAFKQYAKDKGVEASPRLETDAVMVPGKKGRAALFQRDLVVATGDGGYAVISMQRFTNEKDIKEITAKDLTGDGRDELIVRGLLRAKLTGAGVEKEVLREVMLVYSPKPAGKGLALVPVLGVETGRTVGNDYVDSNFRIVTAKGTTPGKIEIMKGSAKGFSASNWPFNKESPTPGLEPILLPWGKEPSITYAWNGELFAR